ncbi:RidA family protein [Gryllotalpicola ginsengisoli]|uniref:RidA family protein n=1 Tax=Gryllotalpicola ginsengisoli TaxID=444608 RepID=UPI0003B7A3B9|nr:RidA family protein [Gryllotalpicola ginsengisoli]
MSGRRISVYTEGFAHANPVPAACRIGPFLFSGVITGRDQRDRSLPPTLDEQCALMFQAIRSVAEAGGGTVDDIVKVTVWLADLGDRAALNREWTAMFPDPQDRPTRHALAGSLEAGKLIECEFVAVIGDKPSGGDG